MRQAFHDDPTVVHGADHPLSHAADRDHPVRIASVSPGRADRSEVGAAPSPAAGRPGRGVEMLKSLIDKVLGCVLLLLVLPVLAALALAVRWDSRGPAFFAQTRVGHQGRPFTLYKLRTMTADAEDVKVLLRDQDEGNGVLFKIKDDPRVTRIGRLLRATSLDELPQLWNVVRGDMSLVGPRPALAEEVAAYTEVERRRLAVKPGLTGPWQVSGRSTLSREHSMRLDVGYAEGWTLAGDLRILFRTIGAVLTRRGAY